MNFYELLVCLVCFTGHLLLTRGDQRGLWIGLLGSAMGLVFFLGRDMYMVALMQVIYALVNLRALLKPMALVRKEK